MMKNVLSINNGSTLRKFENFSHYSERQTMNDFIKMSQMLHSDLIGSQTSRYMTILDLDFNKN